MVQFHFGLHPCQHNCLTNPVPNINDNMILPGTAKDADAVIIYTRIRKP